MPPNHHFLDKNFMFDGFDFSKIDFMGMLCHFDQGVLMTDDQGILVFYNDVQATIDKLDPADVLGKKITDVYKYNNDSSTCMRVLKHGRPIINYALSYSSRNANVGNTIHSVFPLFKGKKIIGTICIVKDYNILERSIPSFLSPRNNEDFAEGTRFTFASILGSDPTFIDAVKTAKMAGNSPSPVILYGETGTGKELFAQAIHNFYYSKQECYMDINCAAIPENLIEGILFGTAKGSYTGALDRAGLFEKANGGTIFLDEINSMPLPLQGKLLRVLQEKKVRRVGSLKSIDLNVKIISSLNRHPKDLIASGEFRMDLFYRLAVIFINIPALRDRVVDIEELGRHFLQKYNRTLGRKIKNISPELIDFCCRYPWPGNVRELQHVIESAVNMTGVDEKTLELEHCYFANLLGKDQNKDRYPAGQSSHAPRNARDYGYARKDPFVSEMPSHQHPMDGFQDRGGKLADTKTHLERTTIIKALETTGGNISKAAGLMGMSRQLLGYKLNKLGLRRYLSEVKFNLEAKNL
ncbi:MAG: sigma 54-interacting transcriptional regulator [Desulfobacterium sp.]|nr:sigma 54-interacting transcriptional regulator [Desulfobacterium sp.]